MGQANATTRFHQSNCRISRRLAARGARATATDAGGRIYVSWVSRSIFHAPGVATGSECAAGDADYGFLGHPVIALPSVPYAIVPPRLEGSGIYRGPKRCYRISFGGRPLRTAARHVGRSDRSSGSD